MFYSRRTFLKHTAGASFAASMVDLSSFMPLSVACAADASVDPDVVQLRPDIEPIVRLIESTPREKCFDMMAQQLQKGLPYRQFMAALFLAGIRNVNPQPPGFKFHCVFVIHAAHQLSLDAPVGERLLPLFWALDDFKLSQQQDVEQGDFKLRPLQAALPSPQKAWSEFHSAMENWDQELAQRAIVALVNSCGANEVIEGLWRYGARDFRNIGHKAIYVANAWRTLQTIGWRHAEPAMRSVVLALLDFGKSRRVNEFVFEDQAYSANVERAKQSLASLPATWTTAAADRGATLELLAAMRTDKIGAACDLTVKSLIDGKASAASVWDAVHLAAGELMMRQPGIYGIHTVTSANALHYAFSAAANSETRLLLLLQGVGWMGQFGHFMSKKGLAEVNICELTPQDVADTPEAAAEQVLALISAKRSEAAAAALKYAERYQELGPLGQAARRLIFAKGTDPHDFKYPAAIFEDYDQVSPTWRPQMLATAVYNLKGSRMPDSPLMQRAREAVKSLN